MENTKRMITCFCGYQSPEGSKYCAECGALLTDNMNVFQAADNGFNAPVNDNIPLAPIGVPGMFAQPMDPRSEETTPNPPDDKGLKLLVDCCRKTLATAYGDSCDETVLYLDEKTGEYQIHTYYRGFGSFNELHRGYKTGREAYDKAVETIGRLGLSDYDGRIGTPMCGGEYVCKCLYGNKIIRLTSANAPERDLYSVEAVLKSFINKENEIFGKTEEE